MDVEDFCKTLQGAGTSLGVVLTVPIGKGLALGIDEMRTQNLPLFGR